MANYNINDFYPRTGQEIKDDGTVVNEANGLNVDGSQNVKIIGRKQNTIQTHNAQSIAANTNMTLPASWIDCDGFDKLALTLLNDSGSSNSTVYIQWSNDNSNIHGYDLLLSSGSGQYRQGITDIKSRYAKIQLINGDATNPHVMSAWTFLKA